MTHVIGAIDGKDAAMECPKHIGPHYHNYKEFLSQVLLAVCDAKYKFTSINVRKYENATDYTLFSKTLDLASTLNHAR